MRLSIHLSRTALCISGLLLVTFSLWAQPPEIIVLINPSLEGEPGPATLPMGWYFCGSPAETPPDLHPNDYFGIAKSAAHGFTYLGMVARPNGSSEAIGQRLNPRMPAGHCYQINLQLCRSGTYTSYNRKTKKLINYNDPLILQIWGSTDQCMEEYLLAETDTIGHKEWKPYTFHLKSEVEIRHIMFKVRPAKGNHLPVSGNLLIDHFSPLVLVNCATGELEFTPDTLRVSDVWGEKDLKTLVGQAGPMIHFDQWNNRLNRSIYTIQGDAELIFANYHLHQLALALKQNPDYRLEIALVNIMKKLSRARMQDLREEWRAVGGDMKQLTIRKRKRSDAQTNWEASNELLFIRLLKK